MNSCHTGQSGIWEQFQQPFIQKWENDRTSVTCNPKHTNDDVFIPLLFSFLSQGTVSQHLQVIQVKHTLSLSQTHTGRLGAASLLNFIFPNVPFPLINSRCRGERNKCGPSNGSRSGSVLLFVAVKLLLMLICFVTVNLSASVNPGVFFCALRERAQLVAPCCASTAQAGTSGTMHSTKGWGGNQ